MGKDASEIRREIELTRARMGDTVEALAYKADLRARLRDAVDDKIETVKGTLGGVVGNVTDTLNDASGKIDDVIVNAKRSIGESWSDPSEVKAAARRQLSLAQQNPVGVGIGALALGFLAGLLAPVAKRDEPRFGGLRRGQAVQEADAGRPRTNA